jgi:REP element-mobilizing transposase RayT
MYLITMTVEGRRPLLGEVVGNPNAPADSPDAPRIELNALGKEVERLWHAIPNYYPEVAVIALQLMPDHLHGILFVKSRTDYHLGRVINGFKIATNRAYRAALEAQGSPLASSSVSPSSSPSPSQRQCRCGVNSHAPASKAPLKQGLLWSKGYTDGILDRKGQLETWKNYLRDNPKRLLIKRLYPDYFRVQRHVKVGTYECSAIGNRFLLSKPLRLQVQCSRSMTTEQIAEACDYYLQQARAGAVLVSPCISPGEKQIMRTAFEAGLPLILLQENGFSDLAKPNGAKFEACAKGQLLIIAPWEHHNYQTTISRAQCLALNDLAREIC